MLNTLFVMEKMCISGKNSAFKALERCVVVFLVIMFLCSCSAEHKAKRFIKNLDNKYEYSIETQASRKMFDMAGIKYRPFVGKVVKITQGE